jgi:hypothetical protein
MLIRMSCEGLYEGRKEKGTQGEEIFTKQIFNKKKKNTSIGVIEIIFKT